MHMYTLRLARSDDLEPMMEIGHEGLRPHAEQHREWVQAEEERGFREHFDLPDVRIIEVGGRAIGYLKVIDMGDHVDLEGIYIERECRSRGIGRLVITDLLARTPKPVRLRVYQSNPARRLYQRLGFRELGGERGRIHMEHPGGI